MVQMDCYITKGWEMEVYVKGPLGKGYLDLINTKTNEYYEVKSKGVYDRGGHINQMRKYDVSTLQNSKRNRMIPNLSIGAGITRGTSTVSGSFRYGFYDVNYYTQENGLIVYETHFNAGRAALYAGAALTIALVPELFPVWLPAASEAMAYAV